MNNRHPVRFRGDQVIVSIAALAAILLLADGQGTPAADRTSPPGPPSASAARAGLRGRGAEPLSRPNIVLFLADDQRWDSIAGGLLGLRLAGVMPEVERGLAHQGTRFTRAFASSPLCCPARAAILSGGFASPHTGVLTNIWPTGGARKFFDTRTVATLLRQQGYRTGFVGKYMNQYGDLFRDGAPPILPGRYVPPGWDAFVAYIDDAPDWRSYPFNFGVGGAVPTAGIAVPFDLSVLQLNLPGLIARGFPESMAEYITTEAVASPPHITEFEQQMALRFLDAAASDPDRPFFLILSSAAPHAPATPDDSDRDLFPGFTYRKRAWAEEDLSDKPAHIESIAAKFWDLYDGTRSLTGDDRLPDAFFGDQLRSLQGLDRAVGEIVRWIEARRGLSSRTVFIYTSDHGVLWGEHRIVGQKKLPYEESIRVPLIIRYPGLPARLSSSLVATDLDLGATLLHLGGYTEDWIENEHGSDGRSLVPHLLDPRLVPRRDIPIHDYRALPLGADPSWAGLRSDLWKFIQYDTLETELYHLATDRFEMESRHESDRDRDPEIRARLADELERRRGLMILSPDWSDGFLPPGGVRQPYDFTFEAVGGKKPYSWSDRTNSFRRSLASCRSGVPPGLILGLDGRLTGTPAQSGCFEFGVQVSDATISPHHGGPQTHLRRGVLQIRD